MCSSSEAGSYLRLIDFVYHSTLGLRVITKRRDSTDEVVGQHDDACSGCEASSYLRRIDSCITQLKAQGPSRTCNESKDDDDDGACEQCGAPGVSVDRLRVGWLNGFSFITSGSGRVPREQKSLKGHLPSVIYPQVY